MSALIRPRLPRLAGARTGPRAWMGNRVVGQRHQIDGRYGDEDVFDHHATPHRPPAAVNQKA